MNCPICGEDMVLREGAKVKFYGCSMYPINQCTGKRDLDGEAWGCYDEDPADFDTNGSRMFNVCLAEGWSYDEAAECARDWQRQEEKDNWK